MKKVKWIMLALVLCLGLVGGAYAYWQETLVITGSVETAEFDVKFENIREMAFGEQVEIWQIEYPNWEGPLPEGERGGATGSFVKTDDKTLTFTIESAWPWLTAYSSVDVVNSSGIPVKLAALKITDANGTEFDGSDYYSGEIHPGAGFGLYNEALHVNLLKYNGGYEWFEIGDELAAGASQQIVVAAYLNGGEVVDPDTEYKFTVEMEWVQWNKP